MVSMVAAVNLITKVAFVVIGVAAVTFSTEVAVRVGVTLPTVVAVEVAAFTLDNDGCCDSCYSNY
jgi:hypothetical protein